MPFPSRGCRTCRQRHLKCDEIRPICGQCKRAARICLGFETGRDSLPFRSENAFASGVARRPRQHTANESRKPSSPLENAAPSSDSMALGQIQRAPDPSLDDLARNYYVHNHMFAAEDLPTTIQSWLETNIMRQQDATSESLLDIAVSAVSLAIFGRTKSSKDALALGRQKYVQALSKTKSAVENLNEATTDPFLLTVMMLSFYEHAVSDYIPEFFLAQSFRHMNGAMTILHLRKTQQQTNTLLDTLVRHLIIKQAVLHAVALPEWIWNGAKFGEDGVRLGLDACMVRLALMRTHLQEIWRDAKTTKLLDLQAELQKVIVEALEIDKELARWAATLPREWIYTTQGESSTIRDSPTIEEQTPERLQYGSTISLYPNFEQAAMWNRYRGSRVVIGCILQKALAYTDLPNLDETGNEQKHPSLSPRKIQEEMQGFVDDICASVPYHFDVMGVNSDLPRHGKPRLETIGARRAFLLSWPLTISMAATGIPAHQRKWIRCRILDIGKITGSGAHELIANMDQNINLRGDSHSISQERLKTSLS